MVNLTGEDYRGIQRKGPPFILRMMWTVVDVGTSFCGFGAHKLKRRIGSKTMNHTDRVGVRESFRIFCMIPEACSLISARLS
jgi:hypothetical protein